MTTIRRGFLATLMTVLALVVGFSVVPAASANTGDRIVHWHSLA